MKRISSLLVAGLMVSLAGCGGNNRSNAPSGSTAGGASIAPTNSATANALNGAHGELVREGGSGELVFLVDGRDDALEIGDPSALTAAGAREGSTLTVSGDLVSNMGGKTQLPTAVQLATHTLDDVTAYGALEDVNGAVVFKSVDGARYTPVGPQASALLAHPLGRPVFLCGTHDPNVRGDLAVSAWRPTTELSVSIRGGLLAYDEQLRILDLDRRGAYRYHKDSRFQARERGRGMLPRATQLAELQRLFAAADVRAQPTVFRGPPIFDVPPTTITLSDSQGEASVTVHFRATPPAGFQALTERLRDLLPTIPSFSVVASGSTSRIRSEGIRTARSELSFRSLWRQHSGSSAAPRASFRDGFVLGAFHGATQSSVRRISIARLERIGDDIHITTRKGLSLIGRLRPLSIANKPALVAQPKTVTVARPKLTVKGLVPKLSVSKVAIAIPRPSRAPFVFAQIEQGGLKGSVYVDGKRLLRVRIPRLPIPPVVALPPVRPLPPIGPRPVPPVVRPLPRPVPPIVRPLPRPPVVVRPQPRPVRPVVVARPAVRAPVVRPSRPNIVLRPVTELNAGTSVGVRLR